MRMAMRLATLQDRVVTSQIIHANRRILQGAVTEQALLAVVDSTTAKAHTVKKIEVGHTPALSFQAPQDRARHANAWPRYGPQVDRSLWLTTTKEPSHRCSLLFSQAYGHVRWALEFGTGR